MPTSFIFSVGENEIAGTTFGTVTAADPEGEPVGFSIYAGNEDGLFAIDTETGAVVTTALLNREARASHSLVARAMDPAGFWSQATVSVDITDVDESPEFLSPS